MLQDLGLNNHELYARVRDAPASRCDIEHRGIMQIASVVRFFSNTPENTLEAVPLFNFIDLDINS